MTDQSPLKAYPSIQGRCPACRGDSLFIGSGGYITCSRLDCPNPSAADELLHRLRPTTALSEHLTETIDEAFSNNYQPGVGLDTAAMTTAVLGALTDHLDIGDAEAWCQTCRRAWDGKHHRCESDAEQRVARVHAALASFDGRGVLAIGAMNFDIPTASEVRAAVRAALEEPEEPPRSTPNSSPTSSDTTDNPHVYLSTGCFHGDHNYCKNPTGLAGAKRPAECKHCGTKCVCACHAVAR